MFFALSTLSIRMYCSCNSLSTGITVTLNTAVTTAESKIIMLNYLVYFTEFWHSRPWAPELRETGVFEQSPRWHVGDHRESSLCMCHKAKVGTDHTHFSYLLAHGQFLILRFGSLVKKVEHHCSNPWIIFNKYFKLVPELFYLQFSIILSIMFTENRPGRRKERDGMALHQLTRNN